MDDIDRLQDEARRATAAEQARIAALVALFEGPPAGAGDVGLLIGDDAVAAIARFLRAMGSHRGQELTAARYSRGWRNKLKKQVLWSGRGWPIGRAAMELQGESYSRECACALTTEGRLRVDVGVNPNRNEVDPHWKGWVPVPTGAHVTFGYSTDADLDGTMWVSQSLAQMLVRSAQAAGVTI